MLQFLIFHLLLARELPVSFVYCGFGISLVTVTYFPIRIHSVLASEYRWRLVVSWYATWHTVRLLGYYTLFEYYRGRGLQGSCILLAFS